MSQFSGNTIQSGYAVHRWGYLTVLETRGRGHIHYTQAQKDEALEIYDRLGLRAACRKTSIPEGTLSMWRRKRDAKR